MTKIDDNDPRIVAWAWRSDGMTGWALGHMKPTPENTHKFYEKNTVVRPLMFIPEPADNVIPFPKARTGSALRRLLDYAETLPK